MLALSWELCLRVLSTSFPQVAGSSNPTGGRRRAKGDGRGRNMQIARPYPKASRGSFDFQDKK